MSLFTRQFTKDLVFSIVFVAGIYSITHNPIVRPIPQALPGNWSIQLMQHPLIFGIAGHNYLVLRDADGEIEKELHGLATDATTREWKYVGTRKTDLLQVWEFDEPRSYLAEKSFPGILLAEGKADAMKELWGKGQSCVSPINTRNIPYPPFGVNMHGDTENSNSVAYTLALCMGLDSKHLGLFTPGDKRNLLNSQ